MVQDVFTLPLPTNMPRSNYPYSYGSAIDYLGGVLGAHEAINTVQAHVNTFVGQSVDIDYPLAFVELDTNVTLTEYSETMPLAVIILDKVEDNRDAYKKTLDRIYNVCKDIVANLDTASTNIENAQGIQRPINVSLVPLIQVTPDNTIGWRMELTIEQPTGLEFCDTY